MGGVESYIRSICESLRGHARFQVLTDRKNMQRRYEQYPEAEVFRVNPPRPSSPFVSKALDMVFGEYARERGRARYYASLSYDVLHLHGPLNYSNTVATGPLFYPFYDRQAWTRVSKPVLFTFHGLSEVILKHHYPNAILSPYFDLWKRIERKNIDKAARVIVVDRYAYQELKRRPGINPDKLVFLLNGIDTRLFFPMPKSQAVQQLNRQLGLSLDQDRPILAFINRLTKDKGIEHLFYLVSRLKGDYTLLIVGAGKYQADVEALARADPRVVYLGSIAQELLPLVLNAADLTINPTLNPGALRVNMESIACHTPVVTYHSGDRFPTEHGRTGWLYRTPNDLVRFVQAFINRRELRGFAHLDQDCRQAVKYFDLRKVSARILQLYIEISEEG